MSSQVTIGPNDGWQGRARPPTSDFAALLALLKGLDRRLSALERAAPLRESGITLDVNSVTMGGSLTATGTTTLGSSTSIAGVGMNTFITQQQGLRSEVLDARGAWDTLGIRLGQISSIANSAQSTANSAQSEVTTARAGSANLNARLNAIAGSIPADLSSQVAALQSRMTTAENNINTIVGAINNGIVPAINVLRGLHSLPPLGPML